MQFDPDWRLTIEHWSTAGAASKLQRLIEAGGEAIEGPWDGEEAITLMADLDAGALGSMTGGGYPDGIRQITDAYFAGRRDDAITAYARWLPLINYENRQCGLATAKILMREGGIIGSDALRHPPADPRRRLAPRPDRDRKTARSARPSMGRLIGAAFWLAEGGAF